MNKFTKLLLMGLCCSLPIDTYSYKLNNDGAVYFLAALEDKESTVISQTFNDIVGLNKKAIIGSWYDGGPYCAHISRGQTEDTFLLRLWYCNVGIENAANVSLISQEGKLLSVDNQISVQLISNDEIRLDLARSIHDKYGNEYQPDRLFNPRFTRSTKEFYIKTEAGNIEASAKSPKEELGCSTAFVTIDTKETHCDFHLMVGGRVFFRGEEIPDVSPLVISYVLTKDSGWAPSDYAKRITIFPRSTSGHQYIIPACGGSGCGTLLIFDSKNKVAKRIALGKYRPIDWIRWSDDGRFAVIITYNGATHWLHVVDMASLNSMAYPSEPSATIVVDPASFSWHNSNTFKIRLVRSPTSNDCVESSLECDGKDEFLRVTESGIVVAEDMKETGSPKNINVNQSTEEDLGFRLNVDKTGVKKRQKLCTLPFICSEEARLAIGAVHVLSFKAKNEFDRGNLCETATFAAARKAAGNLYLRSAYSTLFTSLLYETVDTLFTPFTFGTKVLIGGTSKLALGLVVDSTFGDLEYDKIPKDTFKMLTSDTIGYMAPKLTEKYVDQKLAALAITEAAKGLSDNLLDSLLNQENIVRVSAEANNTGSATPSVDAKVGLVYNEETHYVSMLVRSVGRNRQKCSEKLYVLRYQINDDASPVTSDEVPHEELPVR